MLQFLYSFSSEICQLLFQIGGHLTSPSSNWNEVSFYLIRVTTILSWHPFQSTIARSPCLQCVFQLYKMFTLCCLSVGRERELTDPNVYVSGERRGAIISMYVYLDSVLRCKNVLIDYPDVCYSTSAWGLNQLNDKGVQLILNSTRLNDIEMQCNKT